MNLDIRIPIGLMFSLLGALLTIYGKVTDSDKALYERSLDINVNFIWGIALVVFGSVMLALAIRRKIRFPAD